MEKQTERKDNYRINSQDYWDIRFKTDWKDFSGNEQTAYFASILMEMLPEWLVNDINENALDVCDLGCAEGDALILYREKFLVSKLHGEDFSETAIEYAKQKYAQYDFKTSNILEPEKEKKYPVIICSNVVEHFKETYDVISKVCNRSEQYTIIMFPYREEPGAIDEHERTFHTNNIPTRVDDNQLVYARTMKCDSVLYPYEQILLVYGKNKKYQLLSDLVEEVDSDKNKEVRESLKQQIEKQRADAENRINDLLEQSDNVKTAYEGKVNAIQAQMKELESKNIKLREELQKSSDSERKLSKENEEYQNCILEWQEKFTGERQLSNQKHNEVIQQHENIIKQYEKQIEEHEYAVSQMKQRLVMAEALLKQKDEYIVQTQSMCQHFATGKLMQLNHFLYRLKIQLFKGSKEDRKDFWAWFGGRIRKTNRNIGEGARLNPWMVVNEKLKEALNCRLQMDVSCGGLDRNLVCQEQETISNAASTELHLNESTQKILQNQYTKYDVIILSVIDFNFRHQRPQHFATRFAANGHRVFYVNANFVRQNSVMMEQDNLYIVDFSNKNYNAIYPMNGRDTLPWMRENFDHLIEEQAIRDAVIIVDYPNWVYGAEYIREKYGFKIITDYMDDYTGFLGTTEDFLKNNCVRLLKESDLVVASSQFLYDVASKHTEAERIRIVRNGTEVEHFYKALNLQSQQKTRKVIGYYGAVAHWFAWEKVCSVAKAFPECDVVIVGAVTEYEDKLKKYSNIKLLGEKPYSELPKYLADFDVCLIPFDTSTDLIKATNPVKFYEYLSAGKRIVATEIPELMPFRDKYVYMSNDDEKFVDYVKKCLEGNDELEGTEECIRFAKENDWQKRFEAFAEGCAEVTPKVSIIVLTYNNLELNKQCINSILRKTAYANYELIIVDNCSTDGTVEYLRTLEQEKYSNVKIIFSDVNTGFAGGNNIGIKQSSGEYVLLLNNDTAVSRGWITSMVKHLEKNPKLGMCNPVTNSIGNESQIAVHYTNEQEMDRFAYVYTNSHMNMEYNDVDRLPLFATLIRRDMIQQIGLLDENYKVGMFEDDDYTEAAKKAGYTIVIAEDAFIHHVNNASFKKLDDEKYRQIFEENKAIYEKKWHKKWTMPKYRANVTADINANQKI